MNLRDAKHIVLDGKSAVRLEIVGGLVWRGLPEGYALLDYIETTGTQFIDTGVYPNQDTRAVCEFMCTSSDNIRNIYGARRGIERDNFSFRISANRWQPCYNTEYGTFTTVAVDNGWHTADQNKNEFLLDGILRDTRTYAEFTVPKPIAIGAINGNADIYYGWGRFRAFRIYDNGKLVRDFIPCKSADGVVGMYDTLNGKFYGNAGSGELLAGAGI